MGNLESYSKRFFFFGLLKIMNDVSHSRWCIPICLWFKL